MDEREQDMDAEDIARLDKTHYKEPGRDLMATKPADPSGKGGDVDNPVAQEHSHGTSGDDGMGRVGTRGARHFDRKP